MNASDPEAMSIANQVMEAMGGRKAWDNTRHITWNFFGFRDLYWDKFTGNVRVETPAQNLIALININDKTGRVFKDGNEITDADTLSTFVTNAYNAWVNDSYWLVMPFKLKDSGVTLKYLGQSNATDGEACDMLQLTFQEVGVTPQNKYHVWVSQDSRLVVEWAYFPSFEDEQPRIKTPWTGYERHGEILLSGGRGERNLNNIAVFSDLPERLYTDPTYKLR